MIPYSKLNSHGNDFILVENDGTKPSLSVDQIKYYSKNEKVRIKIARNGKKKYFKLFNETKIAKYFIDISLGNKTSLF